jgi:LEA14-like dessication related protein
MTISVRVPMPSLPRILLGAAASMAMAILLSGTFAACATGKARPAEASASIAGLRVVGLDQRRSRVSFDLELENPGGRPLAIESLDCVVRVEGAEAGRLAMRERVAVAAGGSASLPLELVLDSGGFGDEVMGPKGPSIASLVVEATLRLRDAEGSALSATASAKGGLPLVREPMLRIVSLGIERDLLVTADLKLSLEAYNPNAFPVELGSIDYEFFGEGEPWSSGKAEGPMPIPALSSRMLDLGLELNFADRDRALLDLVAKLRVLRYGLKGRCSVDTGMDYLPAFLLEFDEEGSCQVKR